MISLLGRKIMRFLKVQDSTFSMYSDHLVIKTTFWNFWEKKNSQCSAHRTSNRIPLPQCWSTPYSRCSLNPIIENANRKCNLTNFIGECIFVLGCDKLSNQRSLARSWLSENVDLKNNNSILFSERIYKNKEIEWFLRKFLKLAL